jgi:hypothetical protein
MFPALPQALDATPAAHSHMRCDEDVVGYGEATAEP